MTELRPDCGLPEHEQLDDARCCAREVRELADLYLSPLSAALARQRARQMVEDVDELPILPDGKTDWKAEPVMRPGNSVPTPNGVVTRWRIGWVPSEVG